MLCRAAGDLGSYLKQGMRFFVAKVNLREQAKTLPNELLWPLWDKIADASLTKIEEIDDA